MDGSLGVVLKTTPLRESDLIVTLYTDTHGRVNCVARGARRSKVRFAGTLSLLVLGRFQLGRPLRGDLWNLEGGEIVREWTSVATDVIAVAHASYVAEIVAAIIPPETPEPEALEVMINLWDVLAEGFGVPLGRLLAANLPRTATGHAAAALPTIPALAPLAPGGAPVRVVPYVPGGAAAVPSSALPPWKR